MFDAQQSLIAHLKPQFENSFTIREYAGELKDAAKVKHILPAILVAFADHVRSSAAGSEIPTTTLDLLIINRSACLDKVSGANTNLQFAEDVLTFLEGNNRFLRADANSGSYVLDLNNVNARLMMQSQAITIVLIRIPLKVHK